MFIQTETTPNPRTMKFLPGKEVMPSGNATFTTTEEAAQSPLASALFSIEAIEGVFFGKDFVTVTRSDDVGWDVMKPIVLTTIMEHFVAGRAIMNDTNGGTHMLAESTAHEDDDPLTAQIKELIDTRVRPAVAEDGGDIIFRAFDDGVVKLELYGACSGCPSSTITLKQGIENMLKHYVPEVESVEAVNMEGV